MNNKSQLRLQAKSIRNTLDIKNISQTINTKIINSEFFISSKNIMLFYPLNFEIDLLPLLSIKNKKFYLPRINGESLQACPYKIGDNLIESNFKTKEPVTQNVNPETLDLIFVPALMADKNNYRLGYGKGFYDRFLELTSAKTIVPISKKLVIDKLPVESHDKPVNLIISD